MRSMTSRVASSGLGEPASVRAVTCSSSAATSLRARNVATWIATAQATTTVSIRARYSRSPKMPSVTPTTTPATIASAATRTVLRLLAPTAAMKGATP